MRSDPRFRHPAWATHVSVFAAVSFLVLAGSCHGQENAAMTIPKSLRPCYSNASLLNRDNLPPMSMSSFIELIRKIENWPYQKLDLKNMAVQLTHRFRLDGIERNPSVQPSEDVIPFTPSGTEYFRHRILLTQLIPGTAYNFPNESLSMEDMCALHFMVSSSINDLLRGDEGTVCNNLKNYESEAYGGSYGGSNGGFQNGYGGYGGSSGGFQNGYGGYGPRDKYGRPRRVRAAQPGIESDVEILDPKELGSSISAPEVEPKKAGRHINYVPSTCPVQNGVLWTPWGAVNGGAVLGGIAAGMVPQSVPADTLASDAPRRGGYYMAHPRGMSDRAVSGSIENKWAATFAGNLAEAALLQGPSVGARMIVGLAGGWNSTLEPRWYFHKDTQRGGGEPEGVMSDADIRGDLDGLILGSRVMEWASRASSGLRLSQLLDMYYSERGVFSRDTRACLRRERLTDVATSQQMEEQTYSFATVLHRLNLHSVNLADEKIAEFSSLAVRAVQSYIPSGLNDPPCTLTVEDLMVRPYVDIITVIDGSFQYQDIHPIISHLLEKIEAGLFGSSFMMMDGKDGNVLFNSSYPRLDWYTQYTRQVHESAPRGFDIMRSVSNVMVQLQAKDRFMFEQRRLLGRGQVLLFMPYSNIGDSNRDELAGRMNRFREMYPDVQVLVMAQANKNAYGHIVNDSRYDSFSLTPSDPVGSIKPLVERLKIVPRRMRNPECNPDWVRVNDRGRSDFADYVEPQSINFYRLGPNNFFGVSEAKVRVQGTGGDAGLTVCHSRTEPRPVAPSRGGADTTCQQLGSSSNMEIRLTDPCYYDYYIRDCRPLYISVSSASTSETPSSFRCQEDACRFPDMTKFTISVESLGCWSGAASLTMSRILSVLVVLWLLQ